MRNATCGPIYTNCTLTYSDCNFNALNNVHIMAQNLIGLDHKLDVTQIGGDKNENMAPKIGKDGCCCGFC